MGCGTGKLFPVIAKLGQDLKIIGLDMCQAMLEYAENFKHPDLELIHSFCEDIPLESNSIDVVFINDTFPHFHDRTKALQEISRVLKSDGELYIIHSSCSEQVNRNHRKIGTPVSEDLLPPVGHIVKLIENFSFKVGLSRDTDNYLLIAAQKTN